MRIFVASEKSLSLERRVLSALILASSIIATMLVTEAIMFGYKHAFTVSAIAALSFWGIYGLSIKYIDNDLVLWLYLSASGVVIFADWFYVGGRGGLSLLILIVLAAALPLITKQHQFKTALIFLALITTCLFVSSAIYIHAIAAPVMKKTDVLVQLIEVNILVFVVFYITHLAVNNYRREKQVVSSLNEELACKNKNLEETNIRLQLAYKEIKTLRGLLPVCAYCSKIRSGDIGEKEPTSWVPIEIFIEQNTEASFSHGICPDCVKEHFGEEMYDKIFDETY